MIFIGSLLLICFPLGNGRSLTEKRELPLKETIVPTPGNGSFQSRKFMETLSHSYTIRETRVYLQIHYILLKPIFISGSFIAHSAPVIIDSCQRITQKMSNLVTIHYS